MIKKFVILFVFYVVLATTSMCGTSTNDKVDKSSDWPIPDSLNELGWRATLLVIAHYEYSINQNPQEGKLSYPRRVDWLKTLGNRFAAVYSIRNDTFLEYQLWFGAQNGGDISLTFLAEDGEPLTENMRSMNWYLTKLAADSLMLLFSEKSFWGSESEWNSYFESHKYTKLVESNYELGMYCSPYYLACPPFRAPKLKSRTIWPSMIGLPFALAYDDPFEQFVSDQRTITMLDYSVMAGNKFATIVCRRDESNGAYAIAIGRLDGHLMTYRLLGNRIHSIQGKELENYIDLLVNDKIWSLIGPEGFWESEESMNLLYDSYFNDSVSVEYQTRTLHLDSLFETGYLNRSVQ